MSPGDLVAKIDWDGRLISQLVGVLLEVKIDRKAWRKLSGNPWNYRVLWNDGIIAEHEVGTLRRVWVAR